MSKSAARGQVMQGSGVGGRAWPSRLRWWWQVFGSNQTIAFQCESPEEVDRLYREVTRGGASGCKEPWNAFWGSVTHKSMIPTGT